MMITSAQLQDPSLANSDLVAMVPRINIIAFCENQQTAETIQRAGADRRMSKAHTSVQVGGIPAAVQEFQTQATPNLLVVESLSPRDRVLTDLASLADVCQPETKVIVIGNVNDVLLYRELMRQGVSEYLVAPFSPLQFVEAVASLYHSAKAAPVGRAIAFIGARGGSGSSMLAQNCAWLIAKEHGTETVLADLDIAFGTAGLNFNQDLPSGIADLFEQPDRIDSLLIERMLSKIADRLSILGGPGGVDRDASIEPAAIDATLTAMRTSIPFTVLDLPSTWAPWVRHALLTADQVVITATPELASLRNAKSMIDTLKAARPNDPPPKLVLNQIGVTKRPEIAADNFTKAVGISPSVVIPFDAQSYGLAQNNGQMLTEVAPKSKAALAVRQLVQQLSTSAEKQPKKAASVATSLLERLAKLRKT